MSLYWRSKKRAKWEKSLVTLRIPIRSPILRKKDLLRRKSKENFLCYLNDASLNSQCKEGVGRERSYFSVKLSFWRCFFGLLLGECLLILAKHGKDTNRMKCSYFSLECFHFSSRSFCVLQNILSSFKFIDSKLWNSYDFTLNHEHH